MVSALDFGSSGPGWSSGEQLFLRKTPYPLMCLSSYQVLKMGTSEFNAVRKPAMDYGGGGGGGGKIFLVASYCTENRR